MTSDPCRSWRNACSHSSVTTKPSPKPSNGASHERISLLVLLLHAICGYDLA